MVSVGWGRASRGLTAIPSIRRAGRNRGARAAAQRSAGPPGTGFLLREERRLGLLFVTHDLGVIAQVSQRIAVMYDGRFVEQGTTADVLARPQHDT